MRASRDRISAALQRTGGRAVDTLASDAIARTGLGIGVDPRRYIVALGYAFRSVTEATFRAEVHGRLVTALWHPDDWGVNAFIGLAMVVVVEARLAPAAAADIYRLAGFLAMPEHDQPSPFVPPWFVDAQRCRPRCVTASGVWSSVR